MFHAHLLHIYEPNGDHLFSGHLELQVAEFDECDDEWMINRIETYYGQGTNTVFEVLWKLGDTLSWVAITAFVTCGPRTPVTGSSSPNTAPSHQLATSPPLSSAFLGSVSSGLDPCHQAVLNSLIWDQLYHNQRGGNAYLQHKEKWAWANHKDTLVNPSHQYYTGSSC